MVEEYVPFIIVGGYGDVQQAVLESNGSRSVVAVKKLRPQGDWHQRIRVVAVSRPRRAVMHP